jgi:endonuclease/exonuclease/phosphatase (EEP) superfamily protein YafD
MQQPTTEPGAPAAESPKPPPRRRTRFQRVVRLLSWLSLAGVVSATAALWFASEGTWWGTVLTFLPRHAFLALPALLLVASVCVARRMILVNLAGVLLAAFPLMGARIPLRVPVAEDDGLRIVSCNVQRYQPDFDSVLREITARKPDIVVLQEALWTDPRLERTFPGWHSIQEDEYWIGSRFPIKRLGLCHSKPFERTQGLSVEVDTPRGPFVLHDVHLTTARWGFGELSVHSVIDGSGPTFLSKYTQRRRDEAHECRADVDQNGGKRPAIVVGDFNTPTVSDIYRETWRGFANAFDEAGWGFGYTAPVSEHRHWFDDVPWVRIDHILADNHWTVASCGVGEGNGSDHRPIWAVIKSR